MIDALDTREAWWPIQAPFLLEWGSSEPGAPGFAVFETWDSTAPGGRILTECVVPPGLAYVCTLTQGFRPGLTYFAPPGLKARASSRTRKWLISRRMAEISHPSARNLSRPFEFQYVGASDEES